MNIFSVLDARAERDPERVAIVDHGRQMTYGGLRDAAEELARKLRDAGVRQIDKIGILFPRGMEEIIASFAIAHIGAVAAQIPPAAKAPEISRLADQLALDGIILDPAFTRSVCSENERSVRKLPFAAFPVAFHRDALRQTALSERTLLAAHDAAAIGFSSGTTSASKAILISHEALLARARVESESFGIDRGDSVGYLLSITYPFAPPVLATLSRGARLLIADAGNPERAHALISAHGADVVYAAPLNYRMLLNQEVGTNECLRRARFLVSTGSRLPDRLLEDYQKLAGQGIVNRYGLNECGMVSADFSLNGAKRGSIGTPVTEIKILGDLEDGAGAEASGELLVRGPGMFEGYLSPWRPRQEFSVDQWFRTGDLVKRDEDGFYWIVGRLKEMINVGGLKVVPAEIEDVLTSHPDVQEAVIFGVADPRFGEVPHARVKLVPGAQAEEADLLRYVKDKVAFYKSPRSIEIVEQLPRTPSGKIKRSSLRSP